MNSNDHHYLRINHKNTLDIPTNREKSKLVLSIFTTIASVQEDKVGKEINKYFNMIMPNNESDLYYINLAMAQKYYEKYQLDENSLCACVHSVLQKDYGASFAFDEGNTADVMTILSFCFKALSRYKVSTYFEMVQRVKKAVALNCDAIRLFIDNRTFSALDSFSMRSISFISTSNGCQSQSVYAKNGIGNIQVIPPSSIFTYPKSTKNCKFKELPIEMIILLNKFQSIKKLSFYTEGVQEKQLNEILVLLLNEKWLFPNLLEIDFDLTNHKMSKDIEEIFNRKMSALNKKTTMYTTEDTQFTWMPNREKEGDFTSNNIISNYDSFIPRTITRSRESFRGKNGEEYSHRRYVIEKSSQIEVIIIYSYFISTLKKLQSLSLTFPDSFSLEIGHALYAKKIFYVAFHFLTFCSHLQSLHELRVIFNSLDLYDFQKILGIINNNPTLMNLRLSFFNSDENYSPAALYKLCRRLKLNISDIINDQLLSMREENFENGEVDHLIVNKLLNCFEENLEKLFHVLFNYLSIQELILFFALPKIIANNDLYVMVLIKFVINLLFFLSNEQHHFKVFKLISPLLWFNYRRYPFIEGCIEEVNFEANKTSQLRDFTIQIGFDNVTNISKLLSTRLESLFIGDFDFETLKCFVGCYSSKTFIEASQLNSITISLNNKVVKYKDVKAELRNYFINKPKGLIEQNMASFIQINSTEEANDLIDLLFKCNKVPNNTVELIEGKDVSFNNFLNELTDTPRTIMFALGKTKGKLIMSESIYKSLKQFFYLNKKNPFKIREKR